MDSKRAVIEELREKTAISTQKVETAVRAARWRGGAARMKELDDSLSHIEARALGKMPFPGSKGPEAQDWHRRSSLRDAAKRVGGLEKKSFATNAFSGPMNPVIASGASDLNQGKINPLFRPGQKVAGAWANHAALNAGQAKYYATAANKEHRSVKEVAKNIGYAIVPPHAHHNAEDLAHLREGKMKDWWRAGADPYSPMPDRPKAKVAFKLQGEMKHQDFDIAIENRKGSVRSGTTDDGKKWRTEMKHPYGYIRGTHGADGEEVDCYVGPKKDATHAHVVHQHKPDGTGYDEDKVMLGFDSKAEARKAYLAHYDDPKFLGPMKAVPMEKLKALFESGKKLEKISASAPTRGGFMMASDQNQGRITPLFKAGDMSGVETSFNPGDFKPAKLTKSADISPTSPLGDGGGNPHRAASYQGHGPITPLFNPNVKKAEDGGGAEFGGGAYYYGGAGQMTPVSDMGFKQTSLQGRGPVPALFKKAFATPAGALASSRQVGTAPGAMQAKGPSLGSLSKLPGTPTLPGSHKSTIGMYRGKMQA